MASRLLDHVHQPFANSIDLLEAELTGWVEARCGRLAAEKSLSDLKNEDGSRITVVGEVEDTANEELRRRIRLFVAAEDNVRSNLDARIAATSLAGIKLGLVQVCDQCGLDAVERTTLLLSFCQTVGVYFVDFDRVGPYGFGICDISPDLVARFCELDFTERVRLRQRFGAEGRLVREGLVAVDMGRSSFPSDWPTASIKLTSRGFTALTGLPVPSVGNDD